MELCLLCPSSPQQIHTTACSAACRLSPLLCLLGSHVSSIHRYLPLGSPVAALMGPQVPTPARPPHHHHRDHAEPPGPCIPGMMGWLFALGHAIHVQRKLWKGLLLDSRVASGVVGLLLLLLEPFCIALLGDREGTCDRISSKRGSAEAGHSVSLENG